MNKTNRIIVYKHNRFHNTVIYRIRSKAMGKIIPHCRKKVQKSNRKIVNKCKIDIINTHIHDRLISVHNTGTSMQNGGIKLVWWSQASPFSEMMRSLKCFPRVIKRPIPTYKWEGNLFIKKAIILNINCITFLNLQHILLLLSCMFPCDNYTVIL